MGFKHIGTILLLTTTVVLSGSEDGQEQRMRHAGSKDGQGQGIRHAGQRKWTRDTSMLGRKMD
jgi:hypothetical protein